MVVVAAGGWAYVQVPPGLDYTTWLNQEKVLSIIWKVLNTRRPFIAIKHRNYN